MDQAEWLEYGMANGFCTPPYCDNHDGYHAEDWGLIQDLQGQYGDDFCLSVVRVK